MARLLPNTSADAAILSAEQYQSLQTVREKSTRAARKKAFEAGFGDWIAAEKARVETHGVPGVDLRLW